MIGLPGSLRLDLGRSPGLKTTLIIEAWMKLDAEMQVSFSWLPSFKFGSFPRVENDPNANPAAWMAQIR